MARVPVSFYLSILAGIIVLFGHYAASETGDIALNKVTGALDRFYTLFRNTALTFQHGCVSRLETAFCGPALDSLLPPDTVEHLRVHYCQTPAQDPESLGGTPTEGRSPGEYGSSGPVSVYHQPPAHPLVSRTSEGPLGWLPFSSDWSDQIRLPQAVWDQSGEAIMEVGTLLLRTYMTWRWFRAPAETAGFLFAVYSTSAALIYVFGEVVVMQRIAQMSAIAVVDSLQCAYWELRRHDLDIGVVMVEQAYCSVMHAC